MITSVATLLDELKRKEGEALARHDIRHPTIIGAMFEGLTKKILERGLPEELNLRVVSGVLKGRDGSHSRQIDCILVSGEPERVPNTDYFVCDPEKVLVVVESKKRLYSKELSEGYQEVRSVIDVHKMRPISASSFDQQYRSIVGQVPPSRDALSREPLALQMLYHALITELNLPLRVVLGYDGFASEKHFRESFAGYLQENVGKHGFGPTSFPNLMIAGDFSLVKMNGLPYAARMPGNTWPCLASTKYNPTLLLLEHLWTRLQLHYPLSNDIWGNGYSQAWLNPLINTVCVEKDGKTGWAIEVIDIPAGRLKSAPAQDEWSPAFLDKAQYTLFAELMKQDIDTTKPDFKKFCEASGYDMTELIKRLVQTGLVAYDGTRLSPLTTLCRTGILPDGRYFAGEDKDGGLTEWVSRFMADWKAKPRRIELP